MAAVPHHVSLGPHVLRAETAALAPACFSLPCGWDWYRQVAVPPATPAPGLEARPRQLAPGASATAGERPSNRPDAASRPSGRCPASLSWPCARPGLRAESRRPRHAIRGESRICCTFRLTTRRLARFVSLSVTHPARLGRRRAEPLSSDPSPVWASKGFVANAHLACCWRRPITRTSSAAPAPKTASATPPSLRTKVVNRKTMSNGRNGSGVLVDEGSR